MEKRFCFQSADNTFCLWQPIIGTTSKASSFKLLLKWVVHEKEYIWFLKFDICRASQVSSFGREIEKLMAGISYWQLEP